MSKRKFKLSFDKTELKEFFGHNGAVVKYPLGNHECEQLYEKIDLNGIKLTFDIINDCEGLLNIYLTLIEEAKLFFLIEISESGWGVNLDKDYNQRYLKVFNHFSKSKKVFIELHQTPNIYIFMPRLSLANSKNYAPLIIDTIELLRFFEATPIINSPGDSSFIYRKSYPNSIYCELKIRQKEADCSVDIYRYFDQTKSRLVSVNFETVTNIALYQSDNSYNESLALDSIGIFGSCNKEPIKLRLTGPTPLLSIPRWAWEVFSDQTP